MGLMRKSLFLASGGTSGLFIKANSKKARTAKATEQLARQGARQAARQGTSTSTFDDRLPLRAAVEAKAKVKAEAKAKAKAGATARLVADLDEPALECLLAINANGEVVALGGAPLRPADGPVRRLLDLGLLVITDRRTLAPPREVALALADRQGRSLASELRNAADARLRDAADARHDAAMNARRIFADAEKPDEGAGTPSRRCVT
jgi:hypothetical protein